MEGATGKSKVWIDPKYGMIMRILMAQPGGAPKGAFETTRMTFAAPPAAMFVPACKAGAPVPRLAVGEVRQVRSKLTTPSSRRLRTQKVTTSSTITPARTRSTPRPVKRNSINGR
jgi:hypothetical protein